MCVPVREVRRATVEDVAGCDMLMQAAHGGNMGHSNEIHDAVTQGQDVHGWNMYVMTDSKDGAYCHGLIQLV